MQTIIDVITALFGVIAAGATVVLVIITRRYVHLTKDYVRLTNRLLKATTNTPKIAIYLTPIKGGPNRFILSVKNIGTGPAHDVEFDTNRCFKINGSNTLEDVGFINDGITYLQPGGKMGFVLILVDGLQEPPLKISVTYKDSDSKRYPDCFLLNFGELKNPSYGNPIFMQSMEP